MSWSLYLPYRVGQLHFMTIANMTISGYFGAYAALNWGWPFAATFIAGILIGAAVGYLVSYAIGDAPCFAVVIVGFTFIYITKTVVENVEIFGGSYGLFGIPSVNKYILLAVTYGLIVFVGILINRFDNSRLGRAASGVFIDKDLAASFGSNVKNLGRLLQTAGSAIGGASGVLYIYFMRSLSPEYFTFHIVGACMTMLFVGGYTTMWGVVLAAPILYGGPLLFPPEIASWRIVIYGVLLIVILLAKPDGFITRRLVFKIGNSLSLVRKK
jgi:branched-chain amino acid transport system permease protein